MYDLLTLNFSSTKSFSGYGNGWYEVTYDVGGPDQETINGGSFGVTETKNIGEGSCAPTAAPQACVDKAFTIEMTTQTGTDWHFYLLATISMCLSTTSICCFVRKWARKRRHSKVTTISTDECSVWNDVDMDSIAWD